MCIVLTLSLAPTNYASAGLVEDFFGSTTGWAVSLAKVFLNGLINVVGSGFFIILSLFVGFAAFIVGSIAGIVQGIFSWAIEVFAYVPITTKEAGIVSKVGWPLTRDLVNMLFILILAFIGLATVLRLETYEAKKILPGLLLIALLVNFSLVLVGFVVDVGNIVTKFFLEEVKKNGIGGIAEQWGSVGAYYKGLFDLVGKNLGADINKGEFAMASFFGYFIYGITLIFYSLFATFILFLVALLYFFRVIALWIIAILSPLAFFAYILPNLKQYWDMWLKQLIQWSFIGAILGFFLYLGTEVANSNAIVTALQVDKLNAGGVLYNGQDIFKAANLGFAELLTKMITPIVGLVFMGLGVLAAIQFAPAGANQVINYGKQAGMMATGYGLKAGKYLGVRGAKWAGPRTEAAGKRLRQFAETKPEGKLGTAFRYATAGPIGRWAGRRTGTILEMAGREATGAAIMEEEKTAKDVATKIEEMKPEQVQNLLTDEGRTTTALKWGVGPGLIKEEAISALANQGKLKEALGKKLLKGGEKEVLGTISSLTRKKREVDAVIIASQLSDDKGLRAMYPDKAAAIDGLEMEKMGKRSSANEFRAKGKEYIVRGGLGREGQALIGRADQLDKEAGEIEEKIKEDKKDLTSVINKIPLDKIGKMSQEFVNSDFGRDAMIDHFDGRRMAEVADKFGTAAADAIQRRINVIGKEEGIEGLAKRNPKLAFWLNSNAAQYSGLRLPESIRDKDGNVPNPKELRRKIVEARIVIESNRGKQVSDLEKKYEGRKEMMLRDYHRKDTPDSIKDIIRSIVAGEGKPMPTAVDVKQRIEKLEKEYSEETKKLLKSWGEYQKVSEEKKLSKEDRAEAKKTFESIKKDIEKVQENLLKEEGKRLRDLWENKEK
ncbi:MAG: hypothetical protein HYW70_00080 [Candidatus Nealsonbacteria bacterium]|nr:hypothetical protein [Candidatus Nealsonbacteria bacterium]